MSGILHAAIALLAKLTPAARTDPNETVYALDATSGIDVLHIDRSTAPGRMRTARRSATTPELAAPRLAGLVPHARWGSVCPLPSAGLASAVPGVMGQS